MEIYEYDDAIYKKSQEDISNKSPEFVEWLSKNKDNLLDEVIGFLKLEQIIEVASKDYAVQEAYYEYLYNKENDKQV